MGGKRLQGFFNRAGGEWEIREGVTEGPRVLKHECLLRLPPTPLFFLHSLHQRLGPAPQLALCRVDPNTLNFVRRPNTWASVDWENAGWGDPAFEIADLITHPAYADVPPERWGWLIDAYCAHCGDPSGATRIRVYRLLMQVWGHKGSGDRQLLKQLVHRLRQKIEVDAAAPQMLQTVVGAGYKLIVD